MRTFVLFCFICVISTGALLAGIDMKNSWFGILIAGAAWLILILLKAGRRKADFRKLREHLYREHFLQHYRRRQF